MKKKPEIKILNIKNHLNLRIRRIKFINLNLPLMIIFISILFNQNTEENFPEIILGAKKGQ